MLVLLLVWIYISLLCLAWGSMFLSLAGRLSGNAGLRENMELPIVCLVGLAIAGQLSMWISVFMPLGGKAQALLLAPALGFILYRKNRNFISSRVLEGFRKISIAGYLFLAASVLLILSISSYTISHPDTLAYHAQSILWMEEYPPVPGLVNLHRELGLQSLWFALEAIFSFRWIGHRMVFFPGGAVLTWFFLFIVSNIGGPFVNKKQSRASGHAPNAWPAFLLLYTLLSWTQVRLTAASASPDFIVSLFILASGFLFLKPESAEGSKNMQNLAVMLLCCTAVSIKLSALPLLVIPLSILVQSLRKKHWGTLGIYSLLLLGALIPICIRSYFASGYLFFPSTLADFFHPDWKYPQESAVHFQHYITSYARFPTDNAEAEKAFSRGLLTWVPKWWSYLAIWDRLLLTALGMVTLLGFLPAQKELSPRKPALTLLILVMSLGFLFWFFKAPDPRFGAGYVLGLIYCLVLVRKNHFVNLPRKAGNILLSIMLLGMGLGMTIYTAYRLNRFREPDQLIYPAGIKETAYHRVPCGRLVINRPDGDSDACGAAPLPCATDSCYSFEARGMQVRDGFRARR